ncbi:MAG: GAF domain-containing protein [Deltaproteobacteria bacterium]|nr:MAG: GAF domain-containing protein [Deltaproteobacteria bacterium]
MFGATLSESLGSLLAATVAFAVGSSVVLRDRQREVFARFGAFCFALGTFHLFRFFLGFSGVHLFGWLADVTSLSLPTAADRFFSSFLNARPSRAAGRLRVGLGVALFVVLVVGLVVPDLATRPAWDLVAPLVWAYVVFGLLLAAQRLWRAGRLREGTATAERLRYLYFASLLALAFGSVGAFGMGPVVTAVYLYFVAQTLVRERLLDLPEVAGRILSLSVLVVVVTALYALLLSWVPQRGGSALFLFNAAVASFAVVVLVDPVRTEIDSRIEALLFRDRVHLRANLRRLRQALQRVLSPEEMTDVVLRELAASNRVTRASVYLLDRTGRRLVLAGYVGPVPPPAIDLAVARPLAGRLLAKGAVVRDVLERQRERAPQAAAVELDRILDHLREYGASVAVAMVRPSDPNTLLGVLFVDDERMLEPFSREEISLLAEVAAQAAVTLENSAAYEARKERDRLAALGAMAAGLAHEIRNPLGAIKGAVQVLEADGSTSPSHREFFEIIVDEVDRLGRVVSQFLTYARPFSARRDAVDPKDVLDHAVRLLAPAVRDRVDLDLGGLEGVSIRADADALVQVFHNLLLNAADAIEHGGPSARIRVSGRRVGGEGGAPANVEIRVEDDGPGIPADELPKLFVPFHTTKPGGTGLGLPISQRIVETHGGRIEAANRAPKGAVFTVVLPVSSPAPRAEPSAKVPS